MGFKTFKKVEHASDELENPVLSGYTKPMYCFYVSCVPANLPEMPIVENSEAMLRNYSYHLNLSETKSNISSI